MIFDKQRLYTFADVIEAKELIGKQGYFSDNGFCTESLSKCKAATLIEVDVADHDDYAPFYNGERFFRFFYCV